MSISSDAGPVHAHPASSLAGAEIEIGPDTLVGEVLERHPQSAPVLAAYGLDLCCGASKTLATAASAHGIALSELLGALQAVARTPV